MNILFVTTECLPFAKVGALATFSYELVCALKKKKQKVNVILPLYLSVRENFNIEYITDFSVEMAGKKETALLFKSVTEDFTAYFIGNWHYFHRPLIYGYSDDTERFLFFNKAVVAILSLFKDFKNIDIIHCNDWQTALLPMFLRINYQLPHLKNMSSIFTIHNIKYQGICEKTILKFIECHQNLFTQEGLEFFGKVNLLKAGIIYADYITTLSPSYAQEIQTPYYSEKLDGLIKTRIDDLTGILFGINYKNWSPELDTKIAANYSSTRLSGKAICKQALRDQVGLEHKEIPLISFITGLVKEKGVPLFIDSFDRFLKEEVQIIIAGQGEKYFEQIFIDFARKYRKKVAVIFKDNEDLKRKLYAGSDIVICPSFYEPFSEVPIVALRYGTIPVVRKTGSLADTVVDIKDSKDGYGFTFNEYVSELFFDAIKRALIEFKNKTAWKRVIKKAMRVRFSVDSTASNYIQLYKKLKSRGN